MRLMRFGLCVHTALLLVIMAVGGTFLLGPSSVLAQTKNDGMKRYALVIGNDSYTFQSLQSSAAQDATLVANALASRGFEVFGGRDLSQADIIAMLSEFKKRLETTREQNIVVVYLAGRFVQVANQNFYLPVDYRPIEPIELGRVGVKITDFQTYLSLLAPKGHLLLLDAGNSVPVPLSGFVPVSGFATIKSLRNSAVGINTTPGLLGADYLDPVGPFAHALSEAIRRGAPSWPELFDFVRMRQLEISNADSIAYFSPIWDRAPILFPPSDNPIKGVKAWQQMPLKEASKPSIAFTIALGRGTATALEEFNFIYPADPLVKRVKIILSAIREARIWTQVLGEDNPEAYWSYLKLYPRGGHAAEALYRLSMLDAPRTPKPDSALLIISNPPASVDETETVIKFSPIALDDERLRLQTAVLPYRQLIDAIADRYRAKPAALAKGGKELPVLPGNESNPGQIILPNLTSPE